MIYIEDYWKILEASINVNSNHVFYQASDWDTGACGITNEWIFFRKLNVFMAV